LITLAVAAIVVVIARMKRNRKTRSDPPAASGNGRRSPSTTEWFGYSLAAVMIVTAATITWLGWKERNEIIDVVVIDARTGDRTVYEVRRKALGDREFRTVDGRVVSLGASDRMERIE
ncbi:MAG: hypothetical protein ACNS61_12470, partial [Candidatus Wenzhouxiangella sp. M2_3B_020]